MYKKNFKKLLLLNLYQILEIINAEFASLKKKLIHNCVMYKKHLEDVEFVSCFKELLNAEFMSCIRNILKMHNLCFI